MGGSTASDDTNCVPPSPRTPRSNAEPPLVTGDGRYTRVPSFSASSSGSALSSSDANAVEANGKPRKEVDELQNKSKDELIAEVLALRSRITAWEKLSSSLVAAVALAPEMNAMYARLLRSLLCDALRQVSTISQLLHVECSLPSIASEKPRLTLLHCDSLADTVWDVVWAPSSWWVSVAATGARWGIPFQALTTVRRIQISGRLRCAFASDVTAIRVAFDEEPRLDMQVLAEVGWGVVPIPVQQQIEQVVRSELRRFVTDTLVGENSTVFVLRRKLVNMTAEDLKEAKDAARRANNIKLHSVK